MTEKQAMKEELQFTGHYDNNSEYVKQKAKDIRIDANYSDYEVLDALSYMYGEPNLTIADLNKYTPAEKAKSIIYHESAGLEPLSARTDYCKNRALEIGLKWV